MAAEGQSDKMAPDVGVCTKQRRGIEFLHAEKVAPIDNGQCFLNSYGDQTVDVSTARCWVVCFSSVNSDMKFKPRSGHALLLPVSVQISRSMQALVHCK